MKQTWGVHLLIRLGWGGSHVPGKELGPSSLSTGKSVANHIPGKATSVSMTAAKPIVNHIHGNAIFSFYGYCEVYEKRPW
jgi:hypothetical protein